MLKDRAMKTAGRLALSGARGRDGGPLLHRIDVLSATKNSDTGEWVWAAKPGRRFPK